jgi:hypothetical protein
MTKKEIIEIVKTSTQKNATLPLADLLLLRDVADVKLEMDRDENEYFYKVKIDDIADKELKKEVLSNNGWILSEDENFIILYV